MEPGGLESVSDYRELDKAGMGRRPLDSNLGSAIEGNAPEHAPVVACDGDPNPMAGSEEDGSWVEAEGDLGHFTRHQGLSIC
jgi:hypothetical protein